MAGVVAKRFATDWTDRTADQLLRACAAIRCYSLINSLLSLRGAEIRKDSRGSCRNITDAICTGDAETAELN
jgi:hypothetical protein